MESFQIFWSFLFLRIEKILFILLYFSVNCLPRALSRLASVHAWKLMEDAIFAC